MFCHIWCLWNRNCYHIIFSMIWKEFVIFCHIWTEFGTAMELCRSDHLRPWTPARVSASPFLRGNSSSNGSFMTEYQRLDARQVPQVGRLSCWKLKAKKNNKLYLSFPCVLTCVFINLKKTSSLFGIQSGALSVMQLLPMPRSRQSLWQFPGGNRLPDATILAGDAEMGPNWRYIAWSWFNQQKYGC